MYRDPDDGRVWLVSVISRPQEQVRLSDGPEWAREKAAWLAWKVASGWSPDVDVSIPRK